MSAINLTKEDFIQRVADINVDRSEWQFRGDKPAIIDFYAPWCAPCQRTLPTIHSFAASFNGKVDVYTVNVDNHRELARYFGIRSIPTLVFIPKEGMPIVSPGERRNFIELCNEAKERLNIEL